MRQQQLALEDIKEETTKRTKLSCEKYKVIGLTVKITERSYLPVADKTILYFIDRQSYINKNSLPVIFHFFNTIHLKLSYSATRITR